MNRKPSQEPAASVDESQGHEDGLFRRMVEIAQEGVWLLDAQMCTTFANERMAEMLGYRVREMIGRSMYDFMDDEAREEAERNADRRQAGVRETHEFRFRHKEGRDVFTLVAASPMFSDDGTFSGALGLITDISERRELEERLARAHARDAAGRLAGAIAHDFNNLLTVILTYTGAAARSSREDLVEAIEAIAEAAQRASQLTARLHDLASREPRFPRPPNLEAALAEIEALGNVSDPDLPAPPDAELETPVERTQTLLYVEDNDDIRSLWARYLAQQGFRVLVAADGLEAIQVALRHDGEIDALVTDVVMPRLSGYQAATTLRERYPELRVLYVSGFPGQALPQEAITEPNTSFLAKPVGLEQLLEEICGLLGEAA